MSRASFRAVMLPPAAHPDDEDDTGDGPLPEPVQGQAPGGGCGD